VSDKFFHDLFLIFRISNVIIYRVLVLADFCKNIGGCRVFGVIPYVVGVIHVGVIQVGVIHESPQQPNNPTT
jgi:hypothetical protein